MRKRRYNGWANYETFNIAAWVGNDPSLWELAGRVADYAALRAALEAQGTLETPDGIRYADPALCIEELDAVVRQARS